MKIFGSAFWTFLVLLISKLVGWVSWDWGYILLPVAVLVGAATREYELEKALGQDLTDK